MQVLWMRPGHPAELAGTQEGPGPAGGFCWIDVERSEADWEARARHWLGGALHERHLTDSLNDQHPPFYDGTDDYDMLIARSLDLASGSEAPATRPVALYLFAGGLVSIRPSGDDVFQRLHQRLLSGERLAPESPAALLHLLLHQIVDRLLEQREAVSELLAGWQERLLTPQGEFTDWHPLMQLRARMRRLELTIETQLDALTAWREQTNLTIDQSLAVRFNDLGEHLQRVLRHASVVQTDIDGLVQIHFSATSQRTNTTLQFLTVVSVIFLPLNLLAGIFGMNFEFLPLIHVRWGVWLVFGVMLGLALGLFWWSRHKRWIR